MENLNNLEEIYIRDNNIISIPRGLAFIKPLLIFSVIGNPLPASIIEYLHDGRIENIRKLYKRSYLELIKEYRSNQDLPPYLLDRIISEFPGKYIGWLESIFPDSDILTQKIIKKFTINGIEL